MGVVVYLNVCCIISVFFDRKEDSGNYSCQAYNVEGQVESAPQQLTVMCK